MGRGIVSLFELIKQVSNKIEFHFHVQRCFVFDSFLIEQVTAI